jgi:hypothetical protein
MSSLLLALYVVPALVLFGVTFLALHLMRRHLVLPIEYGTWLLPGVIYWSLPLLVYELRWHGVNFGAPTKSLANLVEPFILALLCWLVFIVRAVTGSKRPHINRQAAYLGIVAGVVLAVAILFAVPTLPE